MTIGGSNHRQIVADVFGDLPDALINELLTRSDEVTKRARESVDARIDERDGLRSRAQQLGLIHQIEDPSDLSQKSVAAVDGSIALIRLAAFEVSAAAALAVDGLGGDDSEDRLPYHFEIHITDPIARAREIVYGLMFCLEYETARKVDRDLVLLDGTFYTGMVAISLALGSAGELRDKLSEAFKRRWTDSTMELVPEILSSDKIIAIPKRSSANEFVRTGLFGRREVDFNGRSTASLILEAGEYAGPFQLETHSFHLDSPDFYSEFTIKIQSMFSEISVVYYKPHDWSHAFRIELPPTIAHDHNLLHETLEAVRQQTTNPAMLEPYPLYVADRFAKSLQKGVAALLESIKTRVTANAAEPNIAADMMNTYRSDPSFEESEP
ncbi:MAG: DNA double-strand break repair nuclease NurA [Chloroflexi bacterium]|nr:DNA double-strand break repair nuclease NurA [Chloroflexota bacterium]